MSYRKVNKWQNCTTLNAVQIFVIIELALSLIFKSTLRINNDHKLGLKVEQLYCL